MIVMAENLLDDQPPLPRKALPAAFEELAELFQRREGDANRSE
jgi:hypothetical protein